MEIIKNYLETMFANMPNTEAVRKAKAELLAMMEDKYAELLNEGRSENEAVGTIISEFGNLDELAEDLGVAKEVEEEKRTSAEQPRRRLSLEDVNGYVARENKSALLVGLGTMLCIISVSMPVLGHLLPVNDAIGAAGMFVCIFAAVGLFVYNGMTGKEWDFVNKELCTIDKSTADYIAGERKRNLSMHALMKAIGIVLCAGCWVPMIAIGAIPVLGGDMGVVIMFFMIGLGVLLIVNSTKRDAAYNKVLTINDVNTISGSYGVKEEEVRYKNDTVASIMSIFWPVVTCLYLSISFLTFAWGITWVIWPIAAIVSMAINTSFRE